MSLRFGFVVVALAAAVLILSETQSFAGRNRRGQGGCSSCGTACAACEATGTTSGNAGVTQGQPAPVAASESSPSDVAAPAAASTEVAAAPAAAPTHYYRANRPARRGVFRR